MAEFGFNHKINNWWGEIYVTEIKALLGLGSINIRPHSSGKNQPPDRSFNTRVAHVFLFFFLKCWFLGNKDNAHICIPHTETFSCRCFSGLRDERSKVAERWELCAIIFMLLQSRAGSLWGLASAVMGDDPTAFLLSYYQVSLTQLLHWLLGDFFLKWRVVRSCLAPLFFLVLRVRDICTNLC